MSKVYFEDWDREDGREQMMHDFQIAEKDLEGVEILYAVYTYEEYAGSAFVLFRKDGKLYEVNGGHCSCYGLEGQWLPEETNVDAIRNWKFSAFPEGVKETVLSRIG